MKARFSALVALVFLLGLASCTSDGENNTGGLENQSGKVEHADATKPAGNLETIRGQYVFGHEVRSLRPCGKEGSLWVVDRTKLLRDLHDELTPEAAPDAEVFVVAAGHTGPPPDEGFGAEYLGTLTVEEVIYVAAEGYGCDFDWSRFLYRAQGNEPYWTLEVLPSQMRLTRQGHADLTWTDVNERRTEGTVVFHAAAGEQPSVELVIDAGPSRDSMSGAYYGLSARLVFDDQTFTGHALRGTAPGPP